MRVALVLTLSFPVFVVMQPLWLSDPWQPRPATEPFGSVGLTHLVSGAEGVGMTKGLLPHLRATRVGVWTWKMMFSFLPLCHSSEVLTFSQVFCPHVLMRDRAQLDLGDMLFQPRSLWM